ncbi:Outer membrane efflux protein [Candidatus Magnetoovum chiemensis]|nr:Outer membrane efflux protein [Candidatus Magnetoovum chiemensis]
MKKTAKLIALSIFIALVSVTPSHPLYADQENILLDSLIKEALDNSPSLNAMNMSIEASKTKQLQSRAFPDPMLMVGIMNEGLDRYTVGTMQMSRYDFGVTQTIPFPGKLKLKGLMSDLTTNELTHSLAQNKLEIIAKVKSLYYDLYKTQNTIELQQLRLNYLSSLEDIALASYSSGRSSVNDALLAQTEKLSVIETLESLKKRLNIIKSNLNMTLGRKSLSSPSFPQIRSINKQPFSHKQDELITLALNNSEKLKKLDLSRNKSSINIDLKRKEIYPDVTISAVYSARLSDEFDDLLGVNISFPLPIFAKTKQKQAVLEAKHLNSKIVKDYEDLTLKLINQITNNLTVIETSDRLISLYEDGLIKKAELTMDASLLAYKSNKSGASTIINNINRIIGFKIKYIEALADREKAIADISVLTGGKL